MFVIIFALFFIITLFTQFFLKNRVANFFTAFFTVTIFYTVLMGVKETSDVDAYLLMFEDSEFKTDFMFRFLSTQFSESGNGYFDLYIFHVFLYGVLYSYFIFRFTNNIFLVLIFYLLIAYVPLVNQIRYYLAFGFFLNSLYFYYFSKRKYLSYVLIILSILSHSGIILLYFFLGLIRFTNDKTFLKKSIFISFILFVLVLLVNVIGIEAYLGSYVSYFSRESISSIAGGIFNVLPYVVIILLVYKRGEYLKKVHPEIKKDRVFNFLLKWSLYPIVFIPVSIFIQIFAHRYIYPFLIIWLLFYCYTLRYEKSFNAVFNRLIFLNVAIICLFYITYFLPKVVLGQNSEYYFQAIESFNSIDYLPNIEQ